MNWLKDCEICNTGLCKTVDGLKGEGLSENAACKQMSDESDGLYSEHAIRNRYRWHTGKRKVEHSTQPKIKRRHLTDIDKESIVTNEFKEGFDVFYKQIMLARHDNWKGTSREAALKWANNAIDLILA